MGKKTTLVLICILFYCTPFFSMYHARVRGCHLTPPCLDSTPASKSRYDCQWLKLTRTTKPANVWRVPITKRKTKFSTTTMCRIIPRTASAKTSGRSAPKRPLAVGPRDLPPSPWPVTRNNCHVHVHVPLTSHAGFRVRTDRIDCGRGKWRETRDDDVTCMGRVDVHVRTCDRDKTRFGENGIARPAGGHFSLARHACLAHREHTVAFVFVT